MQHTSKHGGGEEGSAHPSGCLDEKCRLADSACASGDEVNPFSRNNVYSSAWLLKKLLENDEAFQKRVHNSHVTEVVYYDIGTGNGHASKLFKAEIHFADLQQTYAVVLKLPDFESIDKTRQSFGVSIDVLYEVYNKEILFYNLFGKTLSLPIPKVFAAEPIISNERGGAILMEYLKGRGELQDSIQPFNEQQVRQLVKGISKVMAASLSIDNTAFRRFETSPEIVKSIAGGVKVFAPMVLEAKPGYFAGSIKRLDPVINDPSFIRFVFTKQNSEFNLTPVLSHRDLWAKNIFWKCSESGEREDELLAIFDWQTAHCGTVARDLAQILVVNTDADLRKRVQTEMCWYLHECLESELKARSLSMPFTVEQVKKCYRVEFVMQSLCLMMYTIGFTKPKTEKESEKTTHLKENVWRRLKTALEDAVDILESEMPWWLETPCSLEVKHVS